jgi:hypothetical protein
MKIVKRAVVALLVIGLGSVSLLAQPISNLQLMDTLGAMESPAEDMLDALEVKDIHKLHSLYGTLNSSMEKLNNLPTKSSLQDRELAMLNSWFDLISLEMDEMDDLPALANAINQFSGQLIIATKFSSANQKNVAWMDYLGREILLLNRYPSKSLHHEALLKARRAELHQTWGNIKFLLNEHDGQTLVKKVDPVIQRMLEESDPDKLIALSKRELDLVDDIESFFHID